MTNNLLLIDANFLARRAQHTTGGLENGTIFGFLRDLIILQEKFPDHSPVFCFDSRGSKRKDIYPGYKAFRAARHTFNESQKENEQEFRKQVSDLKFHILYDIGYRNIFQAEGYEADDLIATGCQIGHPSIIVGSDHDFFQLISDDVSMWNTQRKQHIEALDLLAEYGIPPHKWVDVKCIAGCKSDNIAGVPGIGEKTAIKYLQGLLKPGTAAWHKIERSKELIANNRILVELPFPGTPVPDLRSDCVTDKKWNRIIEAWGLKSLRGVIPGKRRKRVVK